MLCIFLLSSCDTGDEIYGNITADSNAYGAGVQTIRITASDLNGDEPTASFRSGISAAASSSATRLRAKPSQRSHI